MEFKKINPRSRLVSATKILSSIGIELKVESVAQKTVLSQIKELEILGREESLQLTEVFKSIDAFNDVASSQIKEMRAGDRYEVIRKNFESILEDSERMVRQVSDDGKMSFINKLQNKLTKWRRGSVEARFNELRNTAEQVFADAEDQIKRELTVLDAYREFRVGLKESTLVSRVLFERAEVRREEYLGKLQQAQHAVNQAKEEGLAPLELGVLELKRDEAQREFEIEDRRLQIATTISEQLLLSFGISEGVMTRYAQTTEVKEKVQQQSATFYTANNGVLTTLTATFKQLQGLHEQTQTINAMVKGTEDALKRLNSMGTTIQDRALQTAYTVNISPEVLRELYNKTVEFRQHQNQLIEEARRTSKINYDETVKVISEGQRALAESLVPRELLEKYTSGKDTSTESVLEISVPQLSAEAIEATRAAETPAVKRAKATP